MELAGFNGRVAFVSGAARGIGRRIAETLRDLGAEVAVGDLQAPEIDGVLGLAMDVTDEASVDAAMSRVEAELGRVDILVVNAGIFVIEPFEETTLASWSRTIDVNLTGAFLCARRAIAGMREAGYGRIVMIGSSAGKTGGAKSMAAYGASKAGVMTLAKSIASEYARSGITSNALAPSLIDTDMISVMPDMHERVPVGRLGTVDDVAALVAFLCSEHAGYITGEVVDINGGFLID
ncbi:MAG TPA: SDR family NAD(P)-dependent oxidoreductase [Solirubrobacteraceae bacterium]|jgi:NAD(P)-dependent dehydrogenase (short-subunit alcohol dehydrogenase family)|nr:SDR family NAD(P)-dependent oxidoreductase [Solirubrobacteraceae bacterium]